jgi:hypothetical protein
MAPHDSNEEMPAGAQPKSKVYADQQKKVLQNLYDIIGINDENKTFLLYDLDHDPEKQARIMALKEDIRRYFFASNSRLFQKEDILPTRPYILVIRSIFKHMKVPYVMTSMKVKIDDKWVATRRYVLL